MQSNCELSILDEHCILLSFLRLTSVCNAPRQLKKEPKKRAGTNLIKSTVFRTNLFESYAHLINEEEKSVLGWEMVRNIRFHKEICAKSIRLRFIFRKIHFPSNFNETLWYFTAGSMRGNQAVVAIQLKRSEQTVRTCWVGNLITKH